MGQGWWWVKGRGYLENLRETAHIRLICIVFAISWHLLVLMPIRDLSMLITWPPSIANCGKGWKTPLSVPRRIWRHRCGYMTWAWTEKRKKKFKKLKKACRTRWLSFNNSVSALYEDLPAVLLTLSSLPEPDSMAYGLLENIHRKFIATLYLLNSVLPHLTYLSVVFHKGKVNFGHIQPVLQCGRMLLKTWKQDRCHKNWGQIQHLKVYVSTNSSLSFFIYSLVLFLKGLGHAILGHFRKFQHWSK